MGMLLSPHGYFHFLFIIFDQMSPNKKIVGKNKIQDLKSNLQKIEEKED